MVRLTRALGSLHQSVGHLESASQWHAQNLAWAQKTQDRPAQAEVYFDLLGTALGYSSLKVFQTWGVYDGDSWIPVKFPGYGQALPFDFNLDKKPAYWAMWNALNGQAEKLPVLAISSGDTSSVVVKLGPLLPPGRNSETVPLTLIVLPERCTTPASNMSRLSGFRKAVARGERIGWRVSIVVV